MPVTVRHRRQNPASVLLVALLAALFAAAQAPQQVPALKVTNVLFEDFNGETFPRFSMSAGGEVSLFFRVEGFARQPQKTATGLPEDVVHLSYEVQLLDAQGIPVQPAERGEVKTVLGPRDQDWRPKVHWTAAVPEYAPTGDYRVQIRLRDEVAQREATTTASFRVRGESFQPSDSLQVQQVEYARSDQGPWFPERYFSPSDTIQVRYKTVGFQLFQNKELWIEQDWTVLDPEGKVVVSQPEAVAMKQRYFYPPRFLFTHFDLQLKDPAPGMYVLRIDVRDRIGEQTVAHESKFMIRR